MPCSGDIFGTSSEDVVRGSNIRIVPYSLSSSCQHAEGIQSKSNLRFSSGKRQQRFTPPDSQRGRIRPARALSAFVVQVTQETAQARVELQFDMRRGSEINDVSELSTLSTRTTTETHKPTNVNTER